MVYLPLSFLLLPPTSSLLRAAAAVRLRQEVESRDSRLSAVRKELEEAQVLLEEKLRVELSLTEAREEQSARLKQAEGMCSLRFFVECRG